MSKDVDQMIERLQRKRGDESEAACKELMQMADEVESHRKPIMDAKAEAEGMMNCAPTAQWMTSYSIEILTSRRRNKEALNGARGILRWLVEYHNEECSQQAVEETPAPCGNTTQES